MSEIRRRVRKRGEKEVLINPVIQEEEVSSVPILKEEPEEEEEPDNFMTREQLKRAEEKYQIRKSLNEIKADITNDKRSQLVESNYWDESHNWGSDSEVESDDYWHFLGRYE